MVGGVSVGRALRLLVALVTLAILASAGSPADWCSLCSCQVSNSKEDRFVNINCSLRGLTDIFNQWPNKITNAQDLPNAKIMATFTGNNLTHLREIPPIHAGILALSFKNCQISDIDSAAFINIKNITFLDLSENQLTGDAVRADIFRGPFNVTEYEPINLHNLFLSNNKIHSLDKKLFKHTPQLRFLALNNNPLSVLDDVTVIAISSAVELKYLDLSFTGISHIPDNMFRSLKNLEILDLSGNNFIDMPSSLPLLGRSLESLNFSVNPIERLYSESFLGLKNLNKLEIRQCSSLTSIEADTFSQLTSLQVLIMNGNLKLSSIDSLAFGNLLNNWPIQLIKLDSNSLSSLTVNLMPWEKVNVSLSNNPWHCNCALNTIIQRLPKERLLDEPACMSPLRLSGVMLTNLSHEKCKNMSDNEEFISIKRGKMIITLPRISTVFIGMGFVALVAIIGAAIGLLGSYIKNQFRLRMMFQPIRYTNMNSV